MVEYGGKKYRLYGQKILLRVCIWSLIKFYANLLIAKFMRNSASEMNKTNTQYSAVGAYEKYKGLSFRIFVRI